MSDLTFRTALNYAGRGWPVFPCLPGQKIPATTHGFRDATTDPGQIETWFRKGPEYNLAVATGAPGPDVLDVDNHGAAGNGFAAFRRLRDADLTNEAAACVRTPSGGLHVYFGGTDQRSGRLPRHHLDFRAQGGYVLVPHSQIGEHRYQVIRKLSGRGGMDWSAAVRLLEPQYQLEQPVRRSASRPGLSHLARWVASQPQGNRNNGLYWAANRALDNDTAADLSPLAIAARQAGLPDPEISRTIDSARKAHQAQDQPEAES